MISSQQKVKEFHETFGIESNSQPVIPNEKTKRLRISLIQEELDELKEAFENDDLIEVADAIADIIYVALGTAVTCGINAGKIFDEVHRSNMTKTGGYYREDGKYMKPGHYSPANIASVIDKTLSKRAEDWIKFSDEVLHHIENYTVPQYGDKGEDQITEWSIEECLLAIKKRQARYGKNVREGQQVLDFLKMAHEVQIACEKYKEELNGSGN